MKKYLSISLLILCFFVEMLAFNLPDHLSLKEQIDLFCLYTSFGFFTFSYSVLTISHEMLAMSYLEPVEVIPAPGVGKMTIPIWGRYRKINGTTDWFGPYFQVYPDGFGPINGGGGNYFNGSLFGSTSIKDKFYLLKPGSGADFADYYYPDNTSWKLSLSNTYIYYTINLKSVITPFISGDVIVDLNSGVTASILIANP